ncbi:hypothetical protein, partial [Streptococcus pneumoniae]|uniref:hypothetical protein n=1 Tax=Streptococcus pneumoniae TaxID=1313 RepID=UPI001E348492
YSSSNDHAALVLTSAGVFLNTVFINWSLSILQAELAPTHNAPAKLPQKIFKKLDLFISLIWVQRPQLL